MDTTTHRFNHRLLDQINTGFKIYMPALDWALRKGCEERGDVFLHDRLVNPAEISFVYSIDLVNGTTTVEVHRSGIDGPVITNTENLPCVQGGPTVIESVMGMVRKIEVERPEQAKIGAAACTVQAIESICTAYLTHQIEKIKTREFGNELWSDRYQLCYVEEKAV